jgi:hypothetical protein
MSLPALACQAVVYSVRSRTPRPEHRETVRGCPDGGHHSHRRGNFPDRPAVAPRLPSPAGPGKRASHRGGSDIKRGAESVVDGLLFVWADDARWFVETGFDHLFDGCDDRPAVTFKSHGQQGVRVAIDDLQPERHR